MTNQVIPAEAIKAAEAAYRETLTELRLSEGGGFKIASQVNRSIHAALEAAAPFIAAQAVLRNPELRICDTESHARSYNEGYEAAMTQGLADDPSLADEWFQEKIREAKEAAWDEGVRAKSEYAYSDDMEPLTNPCRPTT